MKQVKSISRKEKDIVYGYIKSVQKIFPCDDNPYFIIVQLVQDLCLLYFHKIMDSEILTHIEQMKLFDLINDNTIIEYKLCDLLFRGTRDGFSRNDFYKKCNNKQDTICLIQSHQNNVFGGFTSLKWDESRNRGYQTDPAAFLYLIRSNKSNKDSEWKPKVYPIQNGGINALEQGRGYYLAFGDCGYGFWMEGKRGRASEGQCGEFNINENELNGNNVSFIIEQIEVFI